MANRFGYRLYQIFFQTYTEKVWGMPCTDIAADWAAQRIKNLSLWKALRTAVIGSSGLWGTRSEQVITTLIEQFHYPRLGPGMMWETCAAQLDAGGSQTLQGVRVERIAHRDHRLTEVVGRTTQGERLVFEPSACISTMPLQELILALTPAPPVRSRPRRPPAALPRLSHCRVDCQTGGGLSR